MYALTTMTSVTNGGITVNGADSFFTAFAENYVIIIGIERANVSSVISDISFNVNTAFTSATSGNVIYVEDKCVYLRYQLRKIDYKIANFDLDLAGIKKVREGKNEIEYGESTTTLDQLFSLRNNYQQQLDSCEAKANGESVWVFRRLETGTL